MARLLVRNLSMLKIFSPDGKIRGETCLAWARLARATDRREAQGCQLETESVTVHLQLTDPPHNQTFSTLAVGLRANAYSITYVALPTFLIRLVIFGHPSPLILPLDVGKQLVPWHPHGHIIRQLKGQTIGPRNELHTHGVFTQEICLPQNALDYPASVPRRGHGVTSRSGTAQYLKVPSTMPVLAPMPVLSPVCFVVRHDSAAHFLSVTFPTLRRHEESANIVLAHALKLLGSEAALTGCHFINESDVSTLLKQETRPLPLPSSLPSSPRGHGACPATAITKKQKVAKGHHEPFWLTVWSSPSPSVPPVLDVVLSCVNWTLGDYPIFLWTPKNPSSVSPPWLTPRVKLLAEHLLDIVPSCRVFSIFGMTQLVKSFTRHWSDLVKCAIEPEPFYAAYYSFCNPETFKESDDPLSRGDSIRRANMEDLAAVAQLCKEFADDSIYFPLELDAATVEARELILNGLIWIYESEGEVTSICAVTRNTQNVSAITKVFTTPKWRRRGFAEHLVRNVTSRLLFDCGKRSVTLYVGHNNSAQRVYDRVGFVGLCGKVKVNGVEDSLELGLVTGAPRGHW